MKTLQIGFVIPAHYPAGTSPWDVFGDFMKNPSAETWGVTLMVPDASFEAAIIKARSAALEEAAKVVDEYAASVLRVAAMPGEEKPMHQAAHNMCHWTLTRTATVIRALKDKPNE